MSQRNELLASIANTIQDYRGGSLPQPNLKTGNGLA